MNVRMMIATVVLIGLCFGAKAWTQERSAQQQAWTYIFQAWQETGRRHKKPSLCSSKLWRQLRTIVLSWICSAGVTS